MSSFEKIWHEQCDATRGIKARYGDKAAFDYLVGEKLLHFMTAAKTRPEFARELPAFVSEVRTIFPAKKIMTRLDALRNRLAEDASAHDQFEAEGPNSARSDLECLSRITDLLLVQKLGTA